MSITFDEQLSKYAELIVRVGLNLKPGQRLLIGASAFFIRGVPLEAAPLVRKIAEQAYKAGSKYVDVIWRDGQIVVNRFAHAPRDSFEELPSWKIDQTVAYGKKGDALLLDIGEDPDLLAGQDVELVQKVQGLIYQQAALTQEIIETNATNWLAIATPTPGWAAKVLPDVPAGERLERMWQLIFEMCRATGEDPVADWLAHSSALAARCDLLNGRQYKALKYAGPGTDLTVGLPEGHIWRSGQLTSQSGITFVANMPTEEVFTLPHRNQINGTVSATRPLNIGGPTIEGFQLQFENGRVVRATAEKGQGQLDHLLSVDAGARSLGEVALVPHSSPISQSGLIFHNILYDENASCHLALGNAYRFSLSGGTEMDSEAFAAAGGNQSQTHLDFMIGSGELNVDGIRADGTLEPLFRDGEWAD